MHFGTCRWVHGAPYIWLCCLIVKLDIVGLGNLQIGSGTHWTYISRIQGAPNWSFLLFYPNAIQMYVRKECKKQNKIWNGKWSTDLGWPCIFVRRQVYAIRSRCLLFGLAKLAKVIVTQATDEWTTLYDLLWSFHCSSTDTILASIYTTPQL